MYLQTPKQRPRTIQTDKPHAGPRVLLHEAARDLLLVAGMRPTQRAKLIAAGILTIDEFAVATKPDGMTGAFESLRQQAALQVTAVPHEPPPFVMFAPELIGDLPLPDVGDIFFDFEGDPLYREEQTWGLDYLWGLVDRDEAFHKWWAHDFEAEKVALEQFLAWVVERRAKHPGMHIYHYGQYEVSALRRLAGRYGTREGEVDELLRGGVLVDLYEVVRHSMLVGTPSYSIKYVERPSSKLAAELGAPTVGPSAVMQLWKAIDASTLPGAAPVVMWLHEVDLACISTPRAHAFTRTPCLTWQV